MFTTENKNLSTRGEKRFREKGEFSLPIFVGGMKFQVWTQTPHLVYDRRPCLFVLFMYERGRRPGVSLHPGVKSPFVSGSLHFFERIRGAWNTYTTPRPKGGWRRRTRNGDVLRGRVHPPFRDPWNPISSGSARCPLPLPTCSDRVPVRLSGAIL